MKEPEEILNSFPEVKELIEKTTQQIHDIDKLIEQLPKDKGPTPDYAPNGGPPKRSQGRQAENRAIFEKMKETIRQDCSKEVNSLMQYAEPEKQALVDQHLEKVLGKTPDKSDEDKKKSSITEKLMKGLPSERSQETVKAETKEATKEQKARDFSITKELITKLPSSKPMDKWSDNARDILKERD